MDLGYVGIKRDFPEANPLLPHKKKKGRKLTAAQEFNRNHSRIRVVVENAISKIKKFGIMCGKFCNRMYRYDIISDIVCGLVNYRIQYQDLIVSP